LSFLNVFATKTAAIVSAATTYVGIAATVASVYAPTLIPFLSPKAATTLGSVITGLGAAHLALSQSILPKINSIVASTATVAQVQAVAESIAKKAQ